MLTSLKKDQLLQEYCRIMGYATGQRNDETYAVMLSSWQMEQGCLPDDFGLGTTDFVRLLHHHFAGLAPLSLARPIRHKDPERDEEQNDVYTLLVTHRANQDESELWMARVVAMACQGQDHLWQDLGLWSRDQLSELLERNFPALAAMNTKNMKWKKFLYKQLCNTEGIYTCRAPSCEVCTDYDNCFGPEQ